jgi:hypothetical protein
MYPVSSLTAKISEGHTVEMYVKNPVITIKSGKGYRVTRFEDGVAVETCYVKTKREAINAWREH